MGGKEKMELLKIKKMYDEYVLSSYTRENLCLVKGEGAVVEDIEGKKYLDFFPGWAVSGVGHRNPDVLNRVNEQLDRIWHVSNNFYNDVQPYLAKKIIEYSFPGKVFFSNSGAEANEGAIKFARKYGNPARNEIITMEKSFHGRTLATLTATGQDKVKKGFDPLPGGFKYVPYNDIEAFKNAITDKTIAVMLELIQGEGGINVPDKEYVTQMRKITKEKDILMIIDEVQTGMGRTGEMFAYKLFDIEPDAITLAKALGGGFPIGALVIKDEYKDVLPPGSHATTFGGSPIVCAASLGVFDAIEKNNLLENVKDMSKYLVDKLNVLVIKFDFLSKVKGKGLMLGVETILDDASKIVADCIEEGLLINCTQGTILRIMPPINITKEEIDIAIDKLSKVLEKI